MNKSGQTYLHHLDAALLHRDGGGGREGPRHAAEAVEGGEVWGSEEVGEEGAALVAEGAEDGDEVGMGAGVGVGHGGGCVKGDCGEGWWMGFFGGYLDWGGGMG